MTASYMIHDFIFSNFFVKFMKIISHEKRAAMDINSLLLVVAADHICNSA